LTSNELDLSFPTPNYCAVFHQILFKIATTGAMTDRQTHRQTEAGNLVICPMLCYSNGTDEKYLRKVARTGQDIAKSILRYKIRYSEKKQLKIQHKILSCILKIRYYLQNSILHITGDSSDFLSHIGHTFLHFISVVAHVFSMMNCTTTFG